MVLIEDVVVIVCVKRICISLTLQVGWTALSMASYSGHKDIVEALLQAGAKPDVQDQVVECVKCVCVCVCVCMCSMFVCVCVCMCMFISVSQCQYVSLCVFVHADEDTCVHTNFMIVSTCTEWAQFIDLGYQTMSQGHRGNSPEQWSQSKPQRKGLVLLSSCVDYSVYFVCTDQQLDSTTLCR